VSCNNGSGHWNKWKFNRSKSENHQNNPVYLKSSDIINLIINQTANSRDSNGRDIILRSHDVQFNIGNDTFQEVACHNERLGGNDEVR